MIYINKFIKKKLTLKLLHENKNGLEIELKIQNLYVCLMYKPVF